ncbi:hypothetical protein F4678DRAFT_438144 [Xylaria arbuscula]|nr:hypothetical protein F4678DRAFT_438144 [Xylaria arbuscula]
MPSLYGGYYVLACSLFSQLLPLPASFPPTMGAHYMERGRRIRYTVANTDLRTVHTLCAAPDMWGTYNLTIHYYYTSMQRIDCMDIDQPPRAVSAVIISCLTRTAQPPPAPSPLLDTYQAHPINLVSYIRPSHS